MSERSDAARTVLHYCPCAHCIEVRDRPGIWNHFMILCEFCGNKRCPHATYHGHACTRSNEPGQLGSRFGPQGRDENGKCQSCGVPSSQEHDELCPYAKAVAAAEASPPAGDGNPNSRSQQRRIATQRGEPLPTFSGGGLVADKPPAGEPSAVVELPSETGVWFRNGQPWLIRDGNGRLYGIPIRADGWLSETYSNTSLPRGHWRAAAPAGEGEDLDDANTVALAALDKAAALEAELDRMTKLAEAMRRQVEDRIAERYAQAARAEQAEARLAACEAALRCVFNETGMCTIGAAEELYALQDRIHGICKSALTAKEEVR